MDVNNVFEINQIKEILLREDQNLYEIFIDLLKVVNKKNNVIDYSESDSSDSDYSDSDSSIDISPKPQGYSD